MTKQKSDMAKVAQVPVNVMDSGKVSLGGAINLVKPAVTDRGKVKVNGASPSLVKAAIQIRARSSSAVEHRKVAQHLMTRCSSRSVLPHVRQLEELNATSIFQHLVRLDEDDRRLRFEAVVNDQYLVSYVSSINFNRDIVFGKFQNGTLIGVCHLAVFTEAGHAVAEAGISVQKEFRRCSTASELVDFTLKSAASRRITRVYFRYSRSNGPAAAICTRRRATIVVDDNKCLASIDLCQQGTDTYAESRISSCRRIEVFSKGPLEGKIVIFVHGAGGDAWQWRQYFMPYLARAGCRCISFSLRNHGLSPRTVDLRFDDYVNDLKEIIDEECAAGGAAPILVGHSLGGAVVQRYLERNRAERAILLAPVPPTGLQGRRLASARRALRSRFARDTLECAMKNWAPIEVSRINTPISVIGGVMDEVIPLEALLNTANAYGTVAHILPNCGHLLMSGRAWRLAADLTLMCIQGGLNVQNCASPQRQGCVKINEKQAPFNQVPAIVKLPQAELLLV
jgi:pimeloyl-ACP methyl ester carboxylesterase